MNNDDRILILLIVGISAILLLSMKYTYTTKPYGNVNIAIAEEGYMYDSYLGFLQNSNSSATGAYFIEEQFYCVNTSDRNAAEILSTDFEERVHALLFQDWESYNHFCNITAWR